LFEAETYNFDDAELQLVFWQPLYKCGAFLCFVVADWRIRDSGGLAINRNSHFFTFVVKAASVTSHGRVCCYNISGEMVYIA